MYIKTSHLLVGRKFLPAVKGAVLLSYPREKNAVLNCNSLTLFIFQAYSLGAHLRKKRIQLTFSVRYQKESKQQKNHNFPADHVLKAKNSTTTTLENRRCA